MTRAFRKAYPVRAQQWSPEVKTLLEGDVTLRYATWDNGQAFIHSGDRPVFLKEGDWVVLEEDDEIVVCSGGAFELHYGLTDV